MSLQYIIDGYNIIRHTRFTPPTKKTQDDKTALLSFICQKRLTGSSKNKVTVVFDGYPSTHYQQDEDVRIFAIFSRKISADEKIKRLIEESGNPKALAVVSDDREIQVAARMFGAKVLTVEEFIAPKERAEGKRKKELAEPELTYSQKHQINEELRKLWLDEE